MMNNRFRSIAIASAVLALVGCGGGGSDSIVAPAASVRSTAQPQLGMFSAGAQVTYLRPDGTVLATGLTAASSGTAALDLGTYTGPFVARVTGAAGVTYYDEADGSSKPFGPGATMLALVRGSAGGINSIGITPLTNAAAVRSGVSAANPVLGSRTTTDIDIANGQIAAMFGLPVGFDITIAPTAVGAGATTLNASNDASTYAAVLAALAIAAKSEGSDPASAADAFATAYSVTTAGETNSALAGVLSNVKALLSGDPVGGVTLASRLALAPELVTKIGSVSQNVASSGRVPLPEEVAGWIKPACPETPTGGTGGTGGTGATGGSNLGSLTTQPDTCQQ